ncbi:MAG: LemA family protein [Bacteroidia bacterium]
MSCKNNNSEENLKQSEINDTTLTVYNRLIELKNNVDKEWADVRMQYQRRADVLINLIETAKVAATNEKDILIEVTNAREGITEAKEAMSAAKTPAELNLLLQKVQANASSIRLTFEAYPNIRSTEAFLKFQDEIAGIENRISVVRERYNQVTKLYNNELENSSLKDKDILKSFQTKPYFEAKVGSENAPKIKF